MSTERVICNEIVIKEVSQELGLEVKTVRAMMACQSEYTAKVMSSGSFDHIRLPYLGVFKSKPKEIQMINHLQGMTPEQQAKFKHAVRTKKISLFDWDKKKNNNGTTK